MIKVYGTMLCKDCAALEKLYHEKNIPFDFHDIGASLENMKAFLKIRDHSPLFDPYRAKGGIGIPCIILDDGTITLNPEDALKRKE